MKTRIRRGFTLIELLVVVAIISVLIGILLPTLSAARSRGRRTACEGTLHGLGVAMRSYLDGNEDKFPYASFMPSVDPFPIGTGAPGGGGNGPQAVDVGSIQPVYLADVLSNHVGKAEKAFWCPNDNGQIERTVPNLNKSYFSTEKSSYEYKWRLGGTTMAEFIKRAAQFTEQTVHESTIWVLRDYDNFHGEGGKTGARRYLYNDGHVTDFENF